MLFWSLLLLQAALPPNPPAVSAPAYPAASGAATEPPTCPTPPEYSYTDWDLRWDERWYADQWVMRRLHYSRTKTDECRSTSETESKTDGPYRLWQAVPERRVADVNRPEGSTASLSGSPLRTSSLPESGAPAPVGPNPEAIPSRTQSAPTTRPKSPPPFYPGFPLLIGALVYGLVIGRRSRKNTLVAEHTEEPLQGPPFPLVAAHTLDSIQPNTEWPPDSAEVAWLQAFFGIEEQDYGPLTKDAVKRLQERHNIPVDGKRMIGPNTYRALWKEHLNLVHERWQQLARGRRPAELDRILDSPMPPDLRDEMVKLNVAYAAYWAAVEGQYQAILRRDPVLIASYAEQISEFQASGLKVGEIPVLKGKYQPLIDALYQQAEKVKSHPDGGEYAKLLVMLDAADHGRWDDITRAKATWGDRWDTLWSRDKSESAFAERVVSSLEGYASLHLVQKQQATIEPVTTESGTPTVQPTSGTSIEEERNTTPSGLADGWQWPKEPFKLGSASAEEEWQTQQIDSLNKVLVPKAALFVVRNQRIVALKKAGTPPTAAVPLPPKTDPEVQSVIRQLSWDQSKIDKVWAKANEAGIDPRIMLAVVLHEGTGSFNTNADVPVQWWDAKNSRYVAGGSGAQPDFNKDLEHALDAHILAKVRAYGYYGEQFKSAVQAAGLGDGNVFQYANYNVPWFKNGSWTVNPGCYATDTQWWKGIQFIFNKLAGDGADQAYSDYLRSHPVSTTTQPPAVRVIQTNGGTGETEEVREQPWIEARP